MSPKTWAIVSKKSDELLEFKPQLSPQKSYSRTTTTHGLIASNLKAKQKDTTLGVNITGTEFMQLHGSTVVTATDPSATPLTAILIITSIFLFMTLAATAAILVFCRKKNTVFALQKCEQEDEISYELDDMNNTDIEFADFEGEHEAMIAKSKPRKSATCPDLAECLESDDPESQLQRLLDTTESETDDSGKERSPVHSKLKRRSKSFNVHNNGCHGYHQMIVTAVMEIRNEQESLEKQEQHKNKSECYLHKTPNGRRQNLPKVLPFYSDTNLGHNGFVESKSSNRDSDIGKTSIPQTLSRPQHHCSFTADPSKCFNNAKLAFLDLNVPEYFVRNPLQKCDEKDFSVNKPQANCDSYHSIGDLETSGNVLNNIGHSEFLAQEDSNIDTDQTNSLSQEMDKQSNSSLTEVTKSNQEFQTMNNLKPTQTRSYLSVGICQMANHNHCTKKNDKLCSQSGSRLQRENKDDRDDTTETDVLLE